MKTTIVSFLGAFIVIAGFGCSNTCPSTLQTDRQSFGNEATAVGNAFKANPNDKAGLKSLAQKCDALVEKYKSNDGCKLGSQGGKEIKFSIEQSKKDCADIHTAAQ